MQTQISIALLISLLAHYGDCTKCYVCNSASEPACSDPVDPATTTLQPKDCSSASMQSVADMFNTATKKLSDIGQTFGMDTSKTKDMHINAKFVCSKIDFGDGERKEIIRGCVPAMTESLDPCKQVMEQMSKDKKVVSYCGTCERDLCNSALVDYASLTITLLPAIALLLYHN